jgi:hypothetical protein
MQVTNPPPANSLAQAGPPGPPGDQKPRKKAPPSFSAVPRGARRPLDSWTKYAHALMQANEAMFVD